MSKNNWETPPELYSKLDYIFNFKADICASADNALHHKYFSEENSALDAEVWSENEGDWVFMNPPYSPSSLQREFLLKAYGQSKKGIGVVSLVPVATGNSWWADYIWPKVDTVVFLTGGRVPFIDPDNGKAQSAGRQDSCLLIYHPVNRPFNYEWCMRLGGYYWNWKEDGSEPMPI